MKVQVCGLANISGVLGVKGMNGSLSRVNGLLSWHGMFSCQVSSMSPVTYTHYVDYMTPHHTYKQSLVRMNVRAQYGSLQAVSSGAMSPMSILGLSDTPVSDRL